MPLSCLRDHLKKLTQLFAVDAYQADFATCLGTPAHHNPNALARLYAIRKQLQQSPAAPEHQHFSTVIATQLRILEQVHKPGVLHIQHRALRGGTEKYARELAGHLSQYRHYMLTTENGEWLLEDLGQSPAACFYFTVGTHDDATTLLSTLSAWLRLQIIHVHHVLGDRERLLAALRQSRIPYGVTLHDHYLVCPTINLINATQRYCEDEQNPVLCQQCLNQQAHLAHLNIATWRAEHRLFLRQAGFITTPSSWAHRSFQRYFPDLQFKTIEHGMAITATDPTAAPRVFLLPQDRTAHIGILGAMSLAKGEHRLQALVARSRERQLPLRWVLIGYTDEYPEGWQSDDASLTIHGPYDSPQLESLLNHYDIKLVLFPGQAPETFCYTLSDAWQARRAVLVPPIGALQERVQTHGGGWVMQDWQNIDRVLEQLLELTATQNHHELQNQTLQAARFRPQPIQQSAGAIAELYRRLPGVKPDLYNTELSAQTILLAAKLADTAALHSSLSRYHRLIDWLNTAVGVRLRQCLPPGIRRWARQRILGH